MSNPGWSPSNNPYEAPKAESMENTGDTGETGGPWKMNYFGGIAMIQSNPNWITNCLLAGLCALIPVVGPIVLMGYAFETAELLHRSGGKTYWDFNFNRFSDYLTRGVGPFLVGLVFGVIQFIAHIVLQIMLGIMFTIIAGRNPPAILGIIAILVTLSLLIALAIFMFLVQYPLQLRGGLANEVGQAFKFNFAFEFSGKVWREMILVVLSMMLLALVAAPIILITCGLGIIPLLGFAFLMQGWFAFQLYRKYLSLGGAPIPLKPLPAVK